MALEGTIKDFGLADILQLIGIQRKTGVLTLAHRDETVIVTFLDGQVVGADTKDRNLEDLLGSVLVRTGRVTDAQLQDALRIQRETLQRLGYILVRQRFISEEDLVEALRIQVTQIVYRLFRWRDGKYHFAPRDHVDYDTEHFQPLAAETILLEGARMIDEWPIIERRIRSAGMILRQTPAGRELDVPVESLLDTDIDFGFQDDARDGLARDHVALSREERSVLHMVDGRSTVQSIVDASALGEFDVYHTLYELFDRNLIEEAPASAVTTAVSRSSDAGRWVSGALVLAVFALALLGAATIPENPATPWRLLEQRPEAEALRAHSARNRLGRLQQGVETYYFDRGAIPESLDRLAEAEYVDGACLTDPWGRPFSYRRDRTGYEIAAVGPDGASRPGLSVRHPFTPSQRMLLEGGLPEGDAPAP